MKKIFIGLIIVMTTLPGFSQSGNDTIKIDDELTLIKLTDHAYMHVSYKTYPQGRFQSNGLLLINKNEAFLFDTPWTDKLTEKLLSWITDTMHLTLIGFVPNHWHTDCLEGLDILQKQNIKSYANQMTIDIAKSEGLPLPEQGFNDSLELKLGEKLIKCYYLGAAHSMDNIVVWIPSEQILFPGCMVKSINSQNLGNTADGDLTAYKSTLEKIIQKFPSARIVIPGHGNYGGLELIEHTIELTAN